METRDRYRFTLQWGGDTDDKVQAGEALKGLGSRKSKLIVAAVAEYVKAHPESLLSGYSFKTVVEPPITRGEIEAIVRGMIDTRLASTTHILNETGSTSALNNTSQDGIDIMLQNLDAFTS